MILHGCPLNSEAVSIPYMACNPKSYKSATSSVPHSAVDAVFSSAGVSWAPHPNYISCSKGIQLLSLSSVSSPLLSGELGGLSHVVPKLPKRRQFFLPPRAAKSDVPYSYRYPAMTKKPRWW